MIPTRVSLKNFLTFAEGTDRSPITFEFEGAVLWSIAGVNGAGKSAIFDAITYALFGEHRGGRQQDNRLIRKGANTAEVAFEFLQGGQRYRVERSVTRKVGRQGQSRPDSKHVQGSVWIDSDQAWIAVPDTDKPTELERWIRTLLGMGPETFSSSVLLRQGEADKLLNAKANQRFRILAGLIDLRAYQRLEQLAIERRKTAETAADALDQQLADIDDVTDAQLAASAAEAEAADADVKTADDQRLVADRRWQDARRHAELEDRRNTQVTRCGELTEVVDQAERIRAAAAERRHLDTIIEPVTLALQDLAGAADATDQAKQAAEHRDAFDLDSLEADNAKALENQQEVDDELETLNLRQELLIAVSGEASEIVRCRREHAQRVASLAELGDPSELHGQADQLGADLDAARDRLGELENQRTEVIGREGAAQRALQAAQERLSHFEDLSHEPTCSRCNQPITPEHVERERADALSLIEHAQAELDVEQDSLRTLSATVGETKSTTEQLDQRHRAALKASDAARTADEEVERAQRQVEAAVAAAANRTLEDGDVAKLLRRVNDEAVEIAEKALEDLRVLVQTAKSAGTTTKKARDAARKKALTTQKAVDDARRERAEFDRTVGVQDERAKQLASQAALRLRDVPDELATAVKAGDRTVIDQLEDRREVLCDALNELTRLETAEKELSAVLGTISELEHEVSKIPPEHQVPVAEARSLLDTAEQATEDAQSRRDKARDEHQRLDNAHRAHRRLAKKLGEARGKARVAKRLTSLLGKSELQGRLLSDATTGVEVYANDALARISGGTLELDLRRDDSGDGASLDIFVHDRSSAEEPLEVAFISGSQKFRVAVALAAGLGQYLGGDTAIRSLIIDEGFGSLDVDGRQRMIEELRALAEHLDRIIVVSHQEDFTDRTLFPAGFVLRKEGTQTVVERVG